MVTHVHESFRTQLEAETSSEPKRFQVIANTRTLDVFDALCEHAHMDRHDGFQCLLLGFFTGNPYMQSLLGHSQYSTWCHSTQDFINKFCP